MAATRRRGVRRKHETIGGFGRLTGAQREVLTHGYTIIFDGDPTFESEAAEQRAWSQHREVLVSEHLPGQRPAAFYKFDLAVARPNTWPAELEVLLKHDLLSPDERVAIEATRPELSPSQPASLYSAFVRPDVTRMDRGSLERHLEQFSFCAR